MSRLRGTERGFASPCPSQTRGMGGGAAGRRCPERLALVLGLCSWAAALRGKRGPPPQLPARPRGAAGNFGTGGGRGGVPLVAPRGALATASARGWGRVVVPGRQVGVGGLGALPCVCDFSPVSR